MGSLLLLPFSTFAQEEYDDMYFTPKDRKEVKKESVYAADKGVVKADENRDVINPSSSTQIYGNAQENYSSRNVNPEYIERYKSTSKDSAMVDELAEDGSYYVENYDRSNFTEGTEGNQKYQNYTQPGNYYGYAGSFYDPFYSGYSRYGGGFYDPFYSPYYGSGWGFMPGFSMSLSFGTGWGYNPYYSPWGYSRYYSPWYSRYYYSPWAYDPWYGPYGGMGYAGYPGYYSNNYYYVNTNRENISPYNRRVSRGADNYLVNEDAVPNRRTATVNQQKATAGDNNNNRARIEKDYSRSQNEYYTRSRARYETTARANNATVNTSRYQGNSVGTTSTPRVRSSRNEVEYSRPSYRSASDTRTNTYNRGTDRSSSWSNSSYQRSRSGNSYSSPSRSSSGYSSGTLNSGSSGSRSSGYSAPSRSSGSSSSGTRSSGRR